MRISLSSLLATLLLCPYAHAGNGQGGSGIIQQMMAISPGLNFQSTFTKFVHADGDNVIFELGNAESGKVSVISGSEEALESQAPQVLDAIEESANHSNEWVEI